MGQMDFQFRGMLSEIKKKTPLGLNFDFACEEGMEMWECKFFLEVHRISFFHSKVAKPTFNFPVSVSRWYFHPWPWGPQLD